MFDCCDCQKWIGGGLMALLTWIMWLVAQRIIAKNELAPRMKKKQRLREEAFKVIERNYGKVTDEVKKVIDLPDEELLDQLQKRKLTATQVLDAFIAKAYEVHIEHNCIVEFIPMAHTWAEELDALPEVKGPLHGLPVSIKENIDIKGHDSTLGLVKRCLDPKSEHAVIIKTLLDLGAVPFCKTNVPQTLISIGCANPVFGETTNPLNPNLTPGGSSGGEGALIIGGGSRLGIGSDIAGSIRIPAHFCGVFGYKPTNHRFSGTGFSASIPNVIGMAGVPGIISKNMDLMIKASKLLLENNRQHNYDHLTLPIPWDNKPFELKRKLRIGYFTSFPSYFQPAGDTEKVVLNAKKALEKDGHTLIPFPMPDGFEVMRLGACFTFADLGAQFRKNWVGEPIPPSLRFNVISFYPPLWFKKCLAFILNLPIPFLHSPRAAQFVGGGDGVSKDLMDSLGVRKAMIQDLIRRWKDLELDILICPTLPFPAIPIATKIRMQASAVYTLIWNLLDFPAGVVKFGKESGQNILPYQDFGDIMLRAVPSSVEEAIGMPISVQIVGLPFQDEMVLYGMKCLNSLSQDVNP